MTPRGKGAARPVASPCNVVAGLVNRAMGLKATVTLRTVGGGVYGPAMIVEKLTGRTERDGCTIAVSLTGVEGEFHLAEVSSLEIHDAGR